MNSASGLAKGSTRWPSNREPMPAPSTMIAMPVGTFRAKRRMCSS